ncbi:hypothetical protein GMDG_00414 [Pseudogymnoascus destructans 20631-21]|uniref:Uncharacterized protein n=1 Tax=Pseudogymnoascus destructans (strain ATCC MYA-4855 / 20631-21) TaxID=658429 RepID=L8G548_PSED2|nr:hypothetical protein GMDG_00414 [Pseudogymnoascus destructans 20631-21]
MPSTSISLSQTTMWKRMQQGKSAKHQNQPILPGSNGGALEGPQDSFLSPQDGNYGRGLPALPNESEQQPQARQGGKYRPASSLYSQHSPRYPAPATFQEQVSSYEEQIEISPPSSPDLPRSEMAPQSYNTHLSNVPAALSAHPVKSSIPVARREKRRNQAQATTAGLLARREEQAAAATAGLRKTSGTRWDDYPGGANEQGRPPSVQPGQFTPVVTNLEDSYNAAHSAPKAQTAFSDRVRKLKEGNKSGGSKPEWEGSSGRMAIVPAPEDNPSALPLQIPRKSSKRVPSNPSLGGSRVPSPSNETPVVSPTAHGGPQYFLNTTSEAPEPPPHYEPSSPLNSLPSQRVQARRPIAAPATPDKSTLPPSVSTIERNFHEALKDVSISNASGRPQEVSRFSVTTYAPSTTTSSPRPSTDSVPPLPEPYQYTSSVPAHSPILNRRRPVGAPSYTFDRTTGMLRHPPSGDPKFISMTHRASLSKAPPQVPRRGPSARQGRLAAGAAR